MDLSKILNGVENSEEIIKQIQAEIGKEYVLRTDFNTKNEDSKNLQEQFNTLKTNHSTLEEEKKTWDTLKTELESKVAGHELNALKAKIAHEEGIPYELVNRLSGKDESEIKADAKNLSTFLVSNKSIPPHRSTEPEGDNSDGAYKSLLEGLNLGGK